MQSIDQVFDVPVVQVQHFSVAGREKLVEIPQLQPLRLDMSFTRPLCATTDARMVQSAQNCDGPAVAVL